MITFEAMEMDWNEDDTPTEDAPDLFDIDPNEIEFEDWVPKG